MISGKRTLIIPVIHTPPLGYSSEPIQGEKYGEKYQDKIFLRMVTVPGGALYYDATKFAPLYRSPLYVPAGFSLGQVSTADIDSFLARLIYVAFEKDMSPEEARRLNVGLGSKLDRILLRPRESEFTE